MPIYEYRRPDGSTFEVLQSFSAPPLERDPDTGAPVERVLHAPAVHFKGKGFYNTDYGTRKRQRETTDSAEGSASADGSNGSGQSDSSEKGSGEKTPAAGGSSANGSSGSSGEKGKSAAKAAKVPASSAG
jgi:putative FmdB family regulatory protein